MVFLTSNLEDLLVFPGQPETTLTAAEPDDTPSLLDDAKESSPKEKKEPAKPAKRNNLYMTANPPVKYHRSPAKVAHPPLFFLVRISDVIYSVNKILPPRLKVPLTRSLLTESLIGTSWRMITLMRPNLPCRRSVDPTPTLLLSKFLLGLLGPRHPVLKNKVSPPDFLFSST